MHYNRDNIDPLWTYGSDLIYPNFAVQFYYIPALLMYSTTPPSKHAMQPSPEPHLTTKEFNSVVAP